MIKKLRKRILITLTLILTLFFWLILFMINFQNYRFNMRQNLNLLHQLEKPLHIDQKSPGSGRTTSPLPPTGDTKNAEGLFKPLAVCTVQYEENNLHIGSFNQMTNYSEAEILSSAQSILKENKPEGIWKNFLYVNDTKGSANTLYLMDVSPAKERIQNLFLFSLFLGVLGLAFLFWISFILSGWLIQPVDQAFTRQKQFISDASHELKTPLTIIGANAELLEGEIGTNKWLSYIQSEAKRMGYLVQELLSLARLESQAKLPVFYTFSMSKAVTSILLPFESVAFEQTVCLSLDIDDDILFHGNEEQIKQMVSILTDNALQHTIPEGTVKVNLRKTHKKIQLSISNTGNPISIKEQSRIFDRFYRSDSSRERSGNHYGLGLAIAKAIADQHQGSLWVECNDGWTTFHLELPVQAE